MVTTRRLGAALRIRECLVGIILFELGFGLSLVLYRLFEAHAGKLAIDLDADLWGWFYFGLWIIVGVSVISAGIGFVAAESVLRPRSWRERAWVGTLAGLSYGLGWLVPMAIGSLVPEVDVIGVLLFWSYMVIGPILWFVVFARLFPMIRRGQRASAA